MIELPKHHRDERKNKNAITNFLIEIDGLNYGCDEPLTRGVIQKKSFLLNAVLINNLVGLTSIKAIVYFVSFDIILSSYEFA